MLGNTLVTIQTGEAGKQVNRLYITDGVDIGKEYYLDAGRPRHRPDRDDRLDRRRHGHRRTSRTTRLKRSHTITIDPARASCRTTAARCQGAQAEGRSGQAGQKSGGSSMTPSWRSTARMIEINPLSAECDGDKLLVLDAKMSFDSNALFRHKDLAELRD
jgi:succinyl-CoA synthetase beta subunit